MTPALIRRVPALAEPGTAAAFLAVLTSQIGYREGPDNDTIFGADYGMNGAAWCAMYIDWGARNSGCRATIPRFAYTPAGSRWFRDRGQWGSRPRVGALGFVYSSSQGRIHHVFAVTAVDGRFVRTVEGNTSNTGSATGNGVYALRRRADLGQGGYGYPAFKPAPRPAWKVGDGFPGAAAFVVGHAHPAVPVVRRRLLAVGYGTSRSVSQRWTAEDRANTAAYQRARVALRGDADGVLGPEGWLQLLRDYRRAAS